jgi:hypothetical protein
MRASGKGSDGKMTVVILLLALGFMVVLAGGPSEFMTLVERTLEAAAAGVFQMYQNVRA